MKTIDIYGDSTSLGNTWSAAAGFTITPNNEPTELQLLYPDLTVNNCGWSGSNTFEMMTGIRGGIQVQDNWWEKMAASKADVVVINLGINDQFADPADYSEWLGVMIDVAKSYGKIVAIESPNPTSYKNTDNLQGIAIQAMNVAVAHGALVIDQWSDIQQQMSDYETHLPDGIHPDETLYLLKAANLAQALATIDPTNCGIPEGYKVFGVGDFNGTGHNSILVNNDQTGSVGQLVADDDKFTFSEIVTTDWRPIGIEDVDHDWRADILTKDPETGFIGALQWHDDHVIWSPVGFNSPN